MLLSLSISLLGANLTIRKGLYLIILSILLNIVLIVTLAVPLYLIATIKVSLKFGVPRGKFY